MKENKPVDAQKQLLQKYLDGKCTPEESRQVLNWFYRIDPDVASAPSSDDRSKSLERSKSKIMRRLDGVPEPEQCPEKKLFDWKRFSLAAAVLVLVSFALSTYWKNNLDPDPVQLAAQIPDTTGVYKNDIMPGSSYAYLSYRGEKRAIDQKNQPYKFTDKQSAHSRYLVEVPHAGTYKLQLADGTSVWLNSSSSLDYPDDFGDQERRVKLTGEAYFEVTKDKNRPFRIEVAGSLIEVLGTSFNVNAYAAQVNTTLVEGKVKILTGNIERFLLPGEEASIGPEEIKIEQTDVSKQIAWQRGEFYFDGNNLQEILQQIARWYDVEIVNGETLKLSSSYRGSLSRDSKLSEVLNLLAYATKRKFEIDGRKVYIQ